jgi:hypothetical protein
MSTDTPSLLKLPAGAMRAAGAVCAAGGLLFVALGIWGAASRRVEAHPGPDLWYGLASVALVMIVIGVVALGRSGLAGEGAVAVIGLGVAVLGLGLFIVAHGIAAADAGQSDSLFFPIGQIVNALGMVFIGVLVLRTGRWSGWQRATPLICGLYPFLVVLPAFTILGPPVFPVIAGFGLCWLLLGTALYMTPAELA